MKTKKNKKYIFLALSLSLSVIISLFLISNGSINTPYKHLNNLRTNGDMTGLITTSTPPAMLAYPKDYPKELYFDFTVPSKIYNTKLSDGKTEVKSEYVSNNSMKEIVPGYKNILALGGWTVDDTADSDAKIIAKKETANIIVTFTSKTSKTTSVTVQYQR